MSLTIAPSQNGVAIGFVLPRATTPARTNLPGIVRGGQWRAGFIAPPAEGVTWRASFEPGHDAALANVRVLAISSRYPGGEGWQSLPAWLPQDTTVWRMDVEWILPAPLAQVPALR